MTTRCRTYLLQRAPVALTIGALVACTSCATVKPPPGGRLSASEQLLASEAVDRAVARLEWPELERKKVHVSVASPAGDPEEGYLENAVKAALVDRGAVLASEAKGADYELLVLADAVGIEASTSFFGLPAAQSAIIPIALPAIALYDSSRTEGYAKVELVFSDLKRGGVIARSGPFDGGSYLQKRTILLFPSRDSDTPAAERVAE